MNVRVERVVQQTPEVHQLVGELNELLGAVYKPHQPHGLSVERLFEPHVHFLSGPVGRHRPRRGAELV
jgi:putative acetyltransferase